ncbi:hypothetical protein AYI68_g6083 [Smittium mucronatum]|uniref:Uncharacterized protein n=1 Tax=Smittium mucronatum TaxID=133383 RepID=A0A1R0GSJ0_9FUNG|nr:hypothetical protein AYI68_g6083 [Smittium mucronatum]
MVKDPILSGSFIGREHLKFYTIRSIHVWFTTTVLMKQLETTNNDGTIIYGLLLSKYFKKVICLISK